MLLGPLKDEVFRPCVGQSHDHQNNFDRLRLLRSFDFRPGIAVSRTIQFGNTFSSYRSERFSRRKHSRPLLARISFDAELRGKLPTESGESQVRVQARSAFAATKVALLFV